MQMFVFLTSCLVQSIKTTNSVSSDTDTLEPQVEDTSEPSDTAVPNQAPSITVVLDPTEGYYLGAYVTCVATAEDPEDGPLSPTIQGFQNNTELPSTDTELYINPNSMLLNDQITCSATVVDGEGLEASEVVHSG